MAEKSGVSRARISDIERGKVSCNIETIYLLAEALDIDYKYLIDDLVEQ